MVQGRVSGVDDAAPSAVVLVTPRRLVFSGPEVRWTVVVVVLAVAGSARLLLTLFTLATSANPHPLSQGSFILSAALTIASAAMLFRDDARLWLGEQIDETEEPA